MIIYVKCYCIESTRMCSFTTLLQNRKITTSTVKFSVAIKIIITKIVLVLFICLFIPSLRRQIILVVLTTFMIVHSKVLLGNQWHGNDTDENNLKSAIYKTLLLLLFKINLKKKRRQQQQQPNFLWENYHIFSLRFDPYETLY